MELRDALVQISEIRRRIAHGEVFRGYRAATVGASGLLAWLAAACQPSFVPTPSTQLREYLTLWVGAAVVCATLEGIELIWRARAAGPSLTRSMTLLAVEQFLPCVVVGGLLTLCLVRTAPQAAWMLPGLWSLVFSLGVFASYRLLPWQVFWIGVYYLASGLGCLVWGQGEWAFSPWLMGISFGGGQLLAAAVLYWTLERRDDEQA